MSDYQGRETFIIEQAFDANSATKLHDLGTIVRAFDTATTAQGVGEFIYLKGTASTIVGDWVVYNTDDFSTTRASANASGPLAVAMSACVASEFGWYQISGKAVGGCLTQMANDAVVYLTGTAGRVDDDSVLGDYVYRAKGASLTTVGTFVADFEIARPFCNDRTFPV